MRVNVVRFLFGQTGNTSTPTSAGPFLERYGPTFTPRANAITRVPVNLPVRETGPPEPGNLQDLQVIDTLALEVRSPDAIVPLFAAPGRLVYPVLPGRS